MDDQQELRSAVCEYRIQPKRPTMSDGSQKWMVQDSQGISCCQWILMKLEIQTKLNKNAYKIFIHFNMKLNGQKIFFKNSI